MDKTTLVLGASQNPERYSYKAVKSLQRHNVPVIAVGKRKVDNDEITIHNSFPENTGEVHTVSLYLGAFNQPDYYELIISLHPVRIIFNPGTWNTELAEIARKEGIEVVDDCMLAMLSCGHF